MNATMTAMGYLWTSVILAVLILACLDYARRWWKGRQVKRLGNDIDPFVRQLTSECEALMRDALTADFPRPMGAAGYIKESRFTLYAESDADAIAKLTGEAE